MQPLAELDMEVGGVATRALELEGDGPGRFRLQATPVRGELTLPEREALASRSAKLGGRPRH